MGEFAAVPWLNAARVAVTATRLLWLMPHAGVWHGRVAREAYFGGTSSIW